MNFTLQRLNYWAKTPKLSERWKTSIGILTESNLVISDIIDKFHIRHGNLRWRNQTSQNDAWWRHTIRQLNYLAETPKLSVALISTVLTPSENSLTPLEIKAKKPEFTNQESISSVALREAVLKDTTREYWETSIGLLTEKSNLVISESLWKTLSVNFIPATVIYGRLTVPPTNKRITIFDSVRSPIVARRRVVL